MNEIVLDNDELLALAKHAIEQSNFESALVKLKTITQSEDVIVEAYLVLARLYATLKLFEKSRESYQQLLAQVPDSVLARFELGMTLFDTGAFSPAIDEWQSVLDQSQNHPPALFYSALAKANLGEINHAKSHLDTLLSSVSADNEYFQRGRDLSMRLANQLAQQNSGLELTGLDELNATDETTH